MIKRFYEAWTSNPVFDEWGGLWRKHFRIEVENDIFIKLNNYRNRFRFQSLKASCRRLLPRHVYMSVLEWLLPERVSTKPKANNAYPVGGEYVVDIDHYLNYQPHSHRTTEDGVCIGCLENARELTLEVLEAVNENHSQIKVVFSGRRGFHVHVHDFETSDWTRYDEKNPIKSHEVARFRYTSQLEKKVPKAFTGAHFILSCDPMRVITMPESLNGATGLVCAYLGEMREFRTLKINNILAQARKAKHILHETSWKTGNEIPIPRFNRLWIDSHPEPAKT